MTRAPLFLRILAGFLCLSLTVPNPAFALRPQGPDAAPTRTGLEEKLSTVPAFVTELGAIAADTIDDVDGRSDNELYWVRKRPGINQIRRFLNSRRREYGIYAFKIGRTSHLLIQAGHPGRLEGIDDLLVKLLHRQKIQIRQMVTIHNHDQGPAFPSRKDFLYDPRGSYSDETALQDFVYSRSGRLLEFGNHRSTEDRNHSLVRVRAWENQKRLSETRLFPWSVVRTVHGIYPLERVVTVYLRDPDVHRVEIDDYRGRWVRWDRQVTLESVLRDVGVVDPSAGLEEPEEGELELVGFLAELRQLLGDEESDLSDVSQLSPPPLIRRFFQEDPPLQPVTIEALNETVREISRRFKSNPPRDPAIRVLLRRFQAVMVRYLMSTWNLSQEAALDFAADDQAYQGNVWSMQILNWKDSFEQEKAPAGAGMLDFDSSDAMQHIGAYLMLELTALAQQFDNPHAPRQSLLAYGTAFYVGLRALARKMALPEPRFGPQQVADGIQGRLVQWAGREVPRHIRIDILREHHPALRNVALIFNAAFAKTIVELGYPDIGNSLQERVRAAFKSLAQDYPDYAVWKPTGLDAGLEEPQPPQGPRLSRRAWLTGLAGLGVTGTVGPWLLDRWWNHVDFLPIEEIPARWKPFFSPLSPLSPMPYYPGGYTAQIDPTHPSVRVVFDLEGKEIGQGSLSPDQIIYRVVDPRSGETLGTMALPQPGKSKGNDYGLPIMDRAGEISPIFPKGLTFSGEALEGRPQPFYSILERDPDDLPAKTELAGFVSRQKDGSGLLYGKENQERPVARLEPAYWLTAQPEKGKEQSALLGMGSVDLKIENSADPSQDVRRLEPILSRLKPVSPQGLRAQFILTQRLLQKQAALGKFDNAIPPARAAETAARLGFLPPEQLGQLENPEIRALAWDAVAFSSPWYFAVREAARRVSGPDGKGLDEDPSTLRFVLAQMKEGWQEYLPGPRPVLPDTETDLDESMQKILLRLLDFQAIDSREGVERFFSGTDIGIRPGSDSLLYFEDSPSRYAPLVPRLFEESAVRGGMSEFQLRLHQAQVFQRLGYETALVSLLPVELKTEDPEVKSLSHEWVLAVRPPGDQNPWTLYSYSSRFQQPLGPEVRPGTVEVASADLQKAFAAYPKGMVFFLGESPFFQGGVKAGLAYEQGMAGTADQEGMRVRPDVRRMARLSGAPLERDVLTLYQRLMENRFDEITRANGVKVDTSKLGNRLSALPTLKAQYGVALSLLPGRFVRDLETVRFVQEIPNDSSAEQVEFRDGNIVRVPRSGKRTAGHYLNREVTVTGDVGTPVHENFHHYHRTLSPSGARTLGLGIDPVDLFYDISWSQNSQPERRRLLRANGADRRDFFWWQIPPSSSYLYGATNPYEDFAVAGESYVMAGAALRENARQAMRDGNFAPAVKYLFLKYLPLLDTDGKSFEYQLSPASPGLSWDEVVDPLRSLATRKNAFWEHQRLWGLLVRIRELWQIEKESGKIVQRASGAPLVALAGLEELDKKRRALKEVVTRAERAVEQRQWQDLEKAAFAMVPLQGQSVLAEIGGPEGEVWDRLNLLVRRLQALKVADAFENIEDPRIQRWQVEAVALLFSADQLYADTVEAILPDTSVSGAYLWAILYQHWRNRSPSLELVPLMDAMVVLFSVSPRERGSHWKEVEEARVLARNGLLSFLSSAEALSRDELDKRAAEMWWVYSQSFWNGKTAPIPDGLRWDFLLRRPDAIENLSVLYQQFIGSMASTLGFSRTAQVQHAISDRRWASLEERSLSSLWEPPLDHSTFPQHLAQMQQGIVERDWDRVKFRSDRLRVLSAGLVRQGARENQKQFRHLEEILIQLQAGEWPTDSEQLHAVRIWEANALALLAAVSTPSIPLYSSVLVDHFLADPGSLEGELWELLYTFSRFMNPPEGSFTDSSRLEAMEFLTWSAPTERFAVSLEQLPPAAQAQGIQMLADSIRSVPGQAASSTPPISPAIHQQLLMAFSELSQRLGPPPVVLRQRFLLGSDQTTLNLRTFRAQFLSKLADRIGWYREGEKWLAWDLRSNSSAGLEEGKVERRPTSAGGVRGGAFGSGQFPRSLEPLRRPQEQLRGPATSQSPPLLGATAMANPTQPATISTKNSLARTGNFQNNSPAIAPANNILPKSDSVLDVTERRPSVQRDLSISANIEQKNINVNFTAGLEEDRGYVAVEGVGLLVPPELPAERYYVVAIGVEQVEALKLAGRNPRRMIAVALSDPESETLFQLGVPSDQIMKASEWGTLDEARRMAINFGKAWLKGLQGVEASVLEVTANSLQGILAQLQEMLPSPWQVQSPVTEKRAREVQELFLSV